MLNQSSPLPISFVLLFSLLLHSFTVKSCLFGVFHMVQSYWWFFNFLFVRLINFSVPKSKLCLICVRRCSWGIYLSLFGQAHIQRDWLYNTHLWHQALRISCFISHQFSLQAHTRDFVLYYFIFLPTHPPTLVNFVWCHKWQRGLSGISWAVFYFLFIFLIIFSLCWKANCVLFVSGGIVREFGVHESFADHPYDEVG